MLALLPFGGGHGAVELAGHGEGEFLAQTHLVRPFGDFGETDLLREMVEIAVAALIDGFRHVDPAVIAPAIEEAVADPPPATAHDRLVGFDPRIEEGHAMHRLDRRAGGIEALEHLVAQRHALVFAQHGVFDAPDALRKAVGVEARHGRHAQEVARLAIHDDDRAAFEADAARRVVLQRAVDRQPNGIALDVFAGLEIADDPSRSGDFDPARAGHAAQVELELLFQRILADLVPGRDQEWVAVLLLVFLGIGRTDIAEQMADAGPGRVEPRKAALRNHAGKVGQAHADCGEFVIADTRGDLDGLVAGPIVDPFADIGGLVVVEIENGRKRVDRRIGVFGAIGNDVDAEIGPVRSQRSAVAIEHPAAPRGDQRQVDAVALAFELVFLVLGDGDIAHSRGQQHAEPAHGGADDEGSPVEGIVQRRLGYDLAGPGTAAQAHYSALQRVSRKRSSMATKRAAIGKSRMVSTSCGTRATSEWMVGCAPDRSQPANR